MLHLLASGKTVAFLGGAVIGAVAKPVLTSKTVRNATVSVLSKGYQLKNKAEAQWTSIREDAEDLCAEAVMKAYTDNMEEEEEEDMSTFETTDEDDEPFDSWD